MSKRTASFSIAEPSPSAHCEACVVEQEARAVLARPILSTLSVPQAPVQALGVPPWMNPDCEDCVAEYAFIQARSMREPSVPQTAYPRAVAAVPTAALTPLATQAPAAGLPGSADAVRARQSLPPMRGGVAWGVDCVDAAAFDSVSRRVHPVHLAAQEQAGPAWWAGPGKIGVIDALTGLRLRPIALSHPAPEVLAPLTIQDPETGAPVGLLLPDGAFLSLSNA